MRVFVAGATGAIGRALVLDLVRLGYEVFGMTHSAEKASALAAQGVEAVVADAMDAETLRAALARIRPEVVIEELTSLPQSNSRKAMQAASQRDSRVRRVGGANLQAAAQAAGAKRYLIQSSGYWYAPGEGLADETEPMAINASPAVTASVSTYQTIEARVLGAANLEGLALRYGFFYGPGTWYEPDGPVAEQVRLGEVTILGAGRGVYSFVHVEDAAEATALAVERGQPGIYNIVNDQPSEQRVWLTAYARWLGAPAPPRREIAESDDPDSVYYATGLRGASNAKAKRELGWQPRPFEWLEA